MHPDQRFIPADAGNSLVSDELPELSTVHPRGRGEQAFATTCLAFGCGSSPRTRGTAAMPRNGGESSRFIPADAGNRPSSAPCYGSPPVHPRGRGEQVALFKPHSGQLGSSPRTRGTDTRAIEAGCSARFIPADAGNSGAASRWSRLPTVHPRGRGEQDAQAGSAQHVAGSSPRTRGTAERTPLPVFHLRFIPADAGNSECG